MVLLKMITNLEFLLISISDRHLVATVYRTSRVEKFRVFLLLQVSNPGVVKIFSTKTALTCSGAHPSSYSMSTGVARFQNFASKLLRTALF